MMRIIGEAVSDDLVINAMEEVAPAGVAGLVYMAQTAAPTVPFSVAKLNPESRRSFIRLAKATAYLWARAALAAEKER